MLAKRLKKGDTIGIVCPSACVMQEDMETMSDAKRILELDGYKVLYANNVMKNTTGYGSTAREKAEDINSMYKNPDVNAIISLCGGENSNIVYEYLDLDLIKSNNKIICGYSDATSYINYIVAKTGNLGFIGPNFKTISPITNNPEINRDSKYCYREMIKHFTDNEYLLAEKDDEFRILNSGNATGKLIGGNVSLVSEMSNLLDFKNKILFLEELSIETPVEKLSNYLYNLKQKNVFNEIAGLWLGNYDGKYSIEKILMDTLDDVNIKFPIIKSNNFGHTARIMTIPLNVTAEIVDNKIKVIENYLED